MKQRWHVDAILELALKAARSMEGVRVRAVVGIRNAIQVETDSDEAWAAYQAAYSAACKEWDSIKLDREWKEVAPGQWWETVVWPGQKVEA